MAILQIYKAPSGQWSGVILQDGEELGRVGGCESPDEVEDTANESGIQIDDVIRNDLEDAKYSLSVWTSKNSTEEPIRLLDQCEVLNAAPGSVCTLQVMDYVSREWIQYSSLGTALYSLAHWYGLIRSELAWEGPVRVAIAAN